jgi:hypothetical protein
MATVLNPRTDDRPVDATGDAPSGRPRPWRHLRYWFTWRSLLAALVVVLTIEVSLRVVEAHTDVLGERFGLFDEHADRLRTEDPDVLIVGSSSAGSNIWVPTLEEQGIACRAYSPWLASPTMRDIERYVREEVLEVTSPRLVIIGVTMREVNAGTPTPDYPQLHDWLDAEHGPRSVWDRLSGSTAILRSREMFQDPYLFGNVALGWVQPFTDADGHHVASLDQVIADESEEHRAQEESEMADYRLGAAELAALGDMLDLLADREIHAVVVDLPVSELFIEMTPGGRSDYAQYRSAIEAITAQKGVGLIDGASVPIVEARDFADVNHLNREGSIRFTDHILDALPPVSGRSC